MRERLKLLVFFYLITFNLFLPSQLIATASVTDTDTFSIISAPMVKHILETNSGIVINVLSALEFDMQHITGSINIPIILLESRDMLPKDTKTPLVFYCMGKKWPYSEKAARIAVKRGYSKVYRFAGGIPEWRGFDYSMQVNNKYTKIKVKKISPDQVINLIKTQNPYILDVRPHFLKNPSIIKGSISITLMDLTDRISEIPKDREIIITDWAMKQCMAVAKYLILKGYNIIGVMKGGVSRWQAEQKPVITIQSE